MDEKGIGIDGRGSRGGVAEGAEDIANFVTLAGQSCCPAVAVSPALYQIAYRHGIGASSGDELSDGHFNGASYFACLFFEGAQLGIGGHLGGGDEVAELLEVSVNVEVSLVGDGFGGGC